MTIDDDKYLEDLDLDESTEDLHDDFDSERDGDDNDDSDKTDEDGKQKSEEDDSWDDADKNKGKDDDKERDDDEWEDEDKTDYKKKYEEEKTRVDKLSSKLKKGYKKHWEIKAKALTQDDLEVFQQKLETQRKEEYDLIDKFPDAKTQVSDLRKLANDKDLSLDDAYLILNKKRFTDPTYENNRRNWRTSINWNFTHKEAVSVADKIFAKKPKFMEKD